MKKETLFIKSVLKVVKNIPKGKTLSYGDVAKFAGFPGSARAVGTLMKNNHDKSVPCHRVIKSNGEVGEYNNGGPNKKRAIPKREGALRRLNRLSRNTAPHSRIATRR